MRKATYYSRDGRLEVRVCKFEPRGHSILTFEDGVYSNCTNVIKERDAKIWGQDIVDEYDFRRGGKRRYD